MKKGSKVKLSFAKKSIKNYVKQEIERSGREESKIVANLELIKLLQTKADSCLKDYKSILTRLKKELKVNN